jgi:hypothetical protein
MSKPGDITYTAIIDADEMIIREARYAGIDGPSDWFQLPADTDEADAVLMGRGFTRTTPWTIRKTYAGMALEAKLERV